MSESVVHCSDSDWTTTRSCVVLSTTLTGVLRHRVLSCVGQLSSLWWAASWPSTVRVFSVTQSSWLAALMYAALYTSQTLVSVNTSLIPASQLTRLQWHSSLSLSLSLSLSTKTHYRLHILPYLKILLFIFWTVRFPQQSLLKHFPQVRISATLQFF